MKAVLLLSGGMDSTTLLYDLINQGIEVHTISFDYNQRHKKELQSARKITKITNTPHKVVDITGINSLIGGSSLTSKDIEVPEGHYADETMKQTVVPNRNMILLSLAIGYAINIDAGVVYFAAHSGDHAIYPDCRPLFLDKIKEVARVSSYKPIKVQAPYINIDKTEIVRIGKKLGVPYELTWTCYKGGDEPCGVCGSCVEREEALSMS